MRSSDRRGIITLMNKDAAILIYLVACAVHQATPDPRLLRGADLLDLYKISKKHMLTSAAAVALESAGLVRGPEDSGSRNRSSDSEAAFLFYQARGKAIRKTAAMDADRASIFACFESSGIRYMPLKGAVLKDLYPVYGMRQMSDNDILVDPARMDDVRKIMVELGFTTEHFGTGGHDVYHKQPVSNFEMHPQLFGPGHEPRFREYYADVWSRLEKDTDNSFGWHFTPEDFYIYMISHEYKHFAGSGTGLRSLLDTYVYLTEQTLDMDHIIREMRSLGLSEFEKQQRSLAMHLFSETSALQKAKLTEEDLGMLDYILSSGTYGTVQNSVNNKMKKMGGGLKGRFRYLYKRFFVPVRRSDPAYESFEKQYPFFYKHKLLLPLLPFCRLTRALKSGRRRILAEIRTALGAKR